MLGSFGGDLPGLLTACRRLLDRHPAAAALWWACARLLTAADVHDEARAITRDLYDEPATAALALDLPGGAVVAVVPDAAGGSELAAELRSRRDDCIVAHDPAPPPATSLVLLVEGGAVGPDRFLAPAGAADEVAAARDAGVAVWLVVEVGRASGPLFDALVARVTAPAGPGRALDLLDAPEVVPVAAVERVIEPRRVDCPVPPELLRPPGAW